MGNHEKAPVGMDIQLNMSQTSMAPRKKSNASDFERKRDVSMSSTGSNQGKKVKGNPEDYETPKKQV